MKTLIIDDNEMTRTLLRATLTSNGHSILAESGSSKQGLALALQKKPELIFLDIHMPDGNGLDVLKSVRSQLPASKVIMITGRADAHDTCIAAGAHGMIVKPFTSDKLVAAIDAAQGDHPPQRAGALSTRLAATPAWAVERRSGLSLQRFSIGARLYAGFAIVVLLTLLAGAVGHWALNIARSSTNDLVERQFEKERLVTEWRAATNLNGSRTLAMARNPDETERNSLKTRIEATSQDISRIQKQLEVFPKNPEEVGLFDTVDKNRVTYRAAREHLLAALKGGDENEVKRLAAAELEPALDGYVASIQTLAQFEANALRASANKVSQQFARGEYTIDALVAVAFVLATLAAWTISRSILTPLHTAIHISKSVAAGDLTTSGIHVDGSDEISELLWGMKHMTENLGVLIGQVRSGADKIATASGRIATGSMNLAARTEQQTGSLEETASTMEELTSTVRQNADNARQASKLAESASDIATKGGAVVSQVVQTMGAINASSRKIADIISVIDGIAFQTNILALNAAVEAARAGEQGRGFAVVASEVRNLAQRSASAAKEIKELIDASVSSVADGAKLVDHAGDTMQDIVTSIRRVSEIVGEIALAGTEQSSGIEQIGNAIVDLDRMTQQNSLLVDQSLEAAQSMEDQARKMVDCVREFKLDRNHNAGNGNGGGAKTPAARGTPKEAMALVRKALDFRKTCTSRDAFLQGVTNDAKAFADRDMYVFALDRQGKYLAFAGNRSKVGTRVHDIAGIDGQALMDKIIRQGEDGPGWVEYDIINTTNGKVQSKMSYIEVVNDLYVGCGVYTSID